MISKHDAVYKLLSDGQWHARSELARVGGVGCTSRVRDLRLEGCRIMQRVRPGQHETEYRLESGPTFDEANPDHARQTKLL